MRLAGLLLVLLPLLLMGYAYLGYPAIIWLVAKRRGRGVPAQDPGSWPPVTITLPVYNEEKAIAATLESLLALDYPPDRRTILVVSDASTDRTDEIVRGYADRGVSLLRLPHRMGKTAAENAAAQVVTDPIVVNTDATVRVVPHALKSLVRVFEDPGIGLGSGRDVSVGDQQLETNRDESSYVDYEMRIRSLETRAGSIVGASGCLYAVRNGLIDPEFPEALSRDFGAALAVVEQGFRAVSVNDAICLVPRTRSLRSEYRRKVRTMTRGLNTLWYQRKMLSPRQRLIAFSLWSHKLTRWLMLLLLPLLPLGVILLVRPGTTVLLGLIVGAALLGAFGLLGIFWPMTRKPPRPFAVLGFLLIAVVAGLAAWIQFFRGEHRAVWEPTRRQ
jgi:cellulose synthase/poly-beta-1,6-N-acetylglucosamine synthase-like glycosyltransferase